MKIVFMGTPDFALYPLRALVESEHEVVAVVTQPDKPGNRGEIKFSPVKKYALDNGIPVYQFAKISREGAGALAKLNADFFVTAAYGQILSAEILALPVHGVVNVHASLLPAYRGSSPIQWAIINGESETGVTIMLTDVGLDTGDILLRKSIPIDGNDTAGSLFEKLGLLGADAIIEFFEKFISGKIIGERQDEARASYYPMLKKSDGRIDWSMDAEAVRNLVRGVTPWPGAYFLRKGKTIKLYSAEIANGFNGRAGEVLAADKRGLIVGCGKGALALSELQSEGKKRMSYTDFLNGNRIYVGEFFE